MQYWVNLCRVGWGLSPYGFERICFGMILGLQILWLRKLERLFHSQGWAEEVTASHTADSAPRLSQRRITPATAVLTFYQSSVTFSGPQQACLRKFRSLKISMLHSNIDARQNMYDFWPPTCLGRIRSSTLSSGVDTRLFRWVTLLFALVWGLCLICTLHLHHFLLNESKHSIQPSLYYDLEDFEDATLVDTENVMRDFQCFWPPNSRKFQ
jgi:hypothetical protein